MVISSAKQAATGRAQDASAAQARPERPLSPHLGIWRWTLAMALSILHRLTGLGLAAGLVLLVWWLMALAKGAEAFAEAQAFMGSVIGRIVLFAFTLALFFHLLNGIRHLAWDLGLGFSLPAARATGVIVVVLALALTLLAWAVGYAAMGRLP